MLLHVTCHATRETSSKWTAGPGEVRPETLSGQEVGGGVGDVVEMREDEDGPGSPKRKARRPIADAKEGAGDTAAAL